MQRVLLLSLSFEVTVNKTLLAGLIAGMLVAASTASAQDDAMRAKKASKLAEAWLKNGQWTHDYDEALSQAKTSGKLIFAYFTRSYAP